MEFTHVPHSFQKQAQYVMDAAAGRGERSFDLPYHADTQFPKRLEVATILAADTLKAYGQWDGEHDFLDPATAGGKRLQNALARTLHDFNRAPIPEGNDVRWLARHLIHDAETQSFGAHVVHVARNIDDPEYADQIRTDNHPVYMIADRLDRHPGELRTMEMQAMGWYESMPEADQQDLQADFKRQRLTPDQEIYLETMSEPYARTNGLPEMPVAALAKAVAYPDLETIEHAQGLINYQRGYDRQPEAHEYFADDPYLAVTSAVLTTIPTVDTGFPASANSNDPREVIALARVMNAVDVAHEHDIQMTNHDVAAMMLADIKLMANQDRSNVDRMREKGEPADIHCAAVANGRYLQAELPKRFFPGSLTDKSVHVGSDEQKTLVAQLIDVGLKPGERFQFERANDPAKRDERREMLSSLRPGSEHLGRPFPDDSVDPRGNPHYAAAAMGGVGR